MAKVRILVVEDDEDSRNALCAILEALGYEPIAYTSGDEALGAIPGQKFDVALLDIMMPGMSGYELMEKIKEMPEFEELKIIMVTAKDQDSEILAGYQTGADYYITKPFTSKQIEYGIKLYID